MDSPYRLCVFSLFMMVSISATKVDCIGAMKFEVINRANGTSVGEEFESKITESYAMKVMKSAYDLVKSKVYKLEDPFSKSKTDRITLLVVQDFKRAFYGSNNGFIITGEYFEETDFSLPNFNMRIYTAMTHLFISMDVENKLPKELKEAIADFVLLEAGYAKDNWAKAGEGNLWYEKSDVTAQFFKYCDTKEPGFVPNMIHEMKVYSSHYLKEKVDPLWIQYKSAYTNHPP